MYLFLLSWGLSNIDHYYNTLLSCLYLNKTDDKNSFLNCQKPTAEDSALYALFEFAC